MNENLNLVEILKDCPKGTTLYSPIAGEVKLERVRTNTDEVYPIVVYYGNYGIDDRTISFMRDGRYYELAQNGECLLFPSKDQRDWSKFKTKPNKPKFDPKALKPFDKVLVKMSDDGYTTWFADFVSRAGTAYDRIPCLMSKEDSDMIIPYNEETKHLVGTTDEAPEYYRYWED